MKKILFFLFVFVLLLGFAPVTVEALPLQQVEGISFTKMSVSPTDPYPGQEVVITLDYVNNGNAFPAGTAIEYEILLNNEPNNKTSGSVTFEQEVPKDGTGQVKITFFAPTIEADYSITLKVNGENLDFAPESIVVATALPSGLAQLFAGLGIFAAVMAIMAMGTEVVIETLKSILGLKAKVTAMEAFNELKSELPGLLAGMGVDAGGREKIIELANTTQDLIKPAVDFGQIVDKIKAGQFFAAYEALLGLKGKESAPDLDELKKDAKDKIREGLTQLENRLGFGAEIIKDAEQKALDFIDQAKTAEDMDSLVKNVFGALKNMLQNPDDVKAWLLDKMDKFITEGESGLQNFVKEGKQSLAGLGFPESEVNKWLDGALEAVEHTAREKSEVFAFSVRNLLQAVEERRNEIQSPARLVWRRLRKSQIQLWFFDLIFVGLPLGVIWMIFHWWPNADILNAWGANGIYAFLAFWVLPLILGLLAGILLWVLSIVVAWLVSGIAGLIDGSPISVYWGMTLGYFLHYIIEHNYNKFVGRSEELNPPEDYGIVNKTIRDKIDNVSPTTIASTLLYGEDRHQDEETRRVRLIRVISAMVGTVLAYYMKIDAAVYLGYAVPDVVQQINKVVLHDLLPFIPADLTIGMILTGLAASAGSKFWRDLLARLQSARGQVEEAARLVERVKRTISDIT